MATTRILVSTWNDGVFSIVGTTVRQERIGGSVRGLADDGRGGILAIADGHALRRRSPGGEWATIAESDFDLSCCVAVGDVVYVGTEDARILRVEADGRQRFLTGFDDVSGRDRWYAGSAVVDGIRMGPPLGIRSITATSDGAALLANVHVGGIPRSVDSGSIWHPTIDIESDVHQVRAHRTQPDLVIAAAAAGVCTSRDGGATWRIDARGLHAPHCSAVAFGSGYVFVSASVDPFSDHGAVYRRPIADDGPLEPLAGGMPRWLDGVVDTDCIAARDATVAVVDRSGHVYRSSDDGDTWSLPVGDSSFPGASGMYVG